jgi:hypothetical protein
MVGQQGGQRLFLHGAAKHFHISQNHLRILGVYIMQRPPPLPADDECILRLHYTGQTPGYFVRYCLKKDGTQTQEQRITQDGRTNLVRTDTKLDLQDFWSRWNPIIEKILEDSKNGITNITTLVTNTGTGHEHWLVRNHLGESAKITTYGPIQRNISVTGHNQSTLPDYYVDLYDFMFPDRILPMRPDLPGPTPPKSNSSSRCVIS